MEVVGLSQELKELSMREGADLFGIADADCYLDRVYLGNKPQDVMEGVRSVVIVAVAIPNGAVDPLPKGRAYVSRGESPLLDSSTCGTILASSHFPRILPKREHTRDPMNISSIKGKLWLYLIAFLLVAIAAGAGCQDERETGLRAILNYGHTIGHGLEAAGKYARFLHGEAL